MRKSLAVALVAMLGLLLTSASTPLAPAQSNSHINCVIDIQVVCPNNDTDCTDGHWEGPITGCVLQGLTIQFWETERNFLPGCTEHFFEDFYILDGDLTVISGHDAGVWTFSNLKFMANGSIEYATGPWAYLQGYKFHESGRTSDPNLWNPPGTTITGFGTVMTLH